MRELGFFPTNRHLLLEKVEKEEKKESKKKNSTILLPEDYKEEALKPYEVYRVKKVAIDCIQKCLKDKEVIAENHMVQKIEVNGVSYLLVHENNVIGFWMEE